VLLHRHEPPSAAPTAPSRRLHIDVIVDDASGKPVIGLQPLDFTLLDNGRPTRIQLFRAFDNRTTRPQPPVEVILLLDELNLAPPQIAFARDEIARFLLRNGGHLAQPVALMFLTDAGLEVQPRPSTDGNALAGLLKSQKSGISTLNPAMGVDGSLERFRRSIRQIQFLADNEARRPARKLLLWIGNGWPTLESVNYVSGERDQENYLTAIVALSRWLRQARMAVYRIAPIQPGDGIGGREIYYRSFLKPVLNAHQAQSGNLALPVLAVQSGGLVLGPGNDLVVQMDQCLADAGAFYELSFDAPASQGGEFHELKVALRQPNLTARTIDGYYSEPPTN
jgi:VWFA-related protein